MQKDTIKPRMSILKYGLIKCTMNPILYLTLLVLKDPFPGIIKR